MIGIVEFNTKFSHKRVEPIKAIFLAPFWSHLMVVKPADNLRWQLTLDHTTAPFCFFADDNCKNPIFSFDLTLILAEPSTQK